MAWDFSLTDCPPACWVVLAFFPAAPSPTVPVARFVCLGDITQSLSLVLSVWVSSQQFFPPRVSSLVKICFFPRFFVFWRIFFPSFLVRGGILSSCPLSDVYCCTYREDVRNRLPLCQGQSSGFHLSSSKFYLLSTIDNLSLVINSWLIRGLDYQ